MTDELRAVRERAHEIRTFRIAEEACKAVLAKLQLIDDAPTSRVRTDGIVAHSTGSEGLRTRDRHALGVKGSRYADSQIPEGVNLTGTLRSDHAPSKQLSLWAHYSWRMLRAQAQQNGGEMLKLAACASRDYEVYVGRRTVNQQGNHKLAVVELLRDHTGTAAVEVAWYLNVSEKWVRRQRVLNGRDAELGEPRTHDPMTAKILRMKADGATVKVIAAEVGCSTGYVSNVINGKVAA